MTDAPTVDATEIEVEIIVRVRSRAKGTTRNVVRGVVGLPLGKAEHVYVVRPGRLVPSERRKLAAEIAAFTDSKLARR